MANSKRPFIDRSDIITREFEQTDFKEFIFDLQKEIQQMNYRITRVMNIDHVKDVQAMIKGLKIAFSVYKIVEFCNIISCNEIISADLESGVLFPQKFAVYRPLGVSTIHVSFLKPTAIAGIFGKKEMTKTARKMEEEMLEILDNMA